MTFDRHQSRMSSFTCRISAESLVSPGQHQTLTGIPSLVTAIPMTTWGRSSRWSLDFPQVRNPPGARCSPSWLPALPLVSGMPFLSRATGSSSSSVTK